MKKLLLIFLCGLVTISFNFVSAHFEPLSSPPYHAQKIILTEQAKKQIRNEFEYDLSSRRITRPIAYATIMAISDFLYYFILLTCADISQSTKASTYLASVNIISNFNTSYTNLPVVMAFEKCSHHKLSADECFETLKKSKEFKEYFTKHNYTAEKFKTDYNKIK